MNQVWFIDGPYKNFLPSMQGMEDSIEQASDFQPFFTVSSHENPQKMSENGSIRIESFLNVLEKGSLKNGSKIKVTDGSLVDFWDDRDSVETGSLKKKAMQIKERGVLGGKGNLGATKKLKFAWKS